MRWWPARSGRRPRCRGVRRCCSRSGRPFSGAAAMSPPRSPPSTARCSMTRWARFSAGSRSWSSPAVLPTCSRVASATVSSTGVDVYSIRQPLGVVAVISPFNFPAMVPLWFVPVAIACGNAVVLKPSEKDPSASTAARRAVGRGRAAAGRVQRRARRQGGCRRAAGAPGREGGLVRRLDADRALRLRARHRARQASAGSRRGQEPHGRAAGRRPRGRGRRCGLGRLRLGGGAVHGDLRDRRRRPRGRRADPVDRRADGVRCAPATAGVAATWGRSSLARTATRWRRTSRRARPPAPRWWSTAARWCRTATPTGSGWGRRSSTTSRPT